LCCRTELETSAAFGQPSSLRHHLTPSGPQTWFSSLSVLPSVTTRHRRLCRYSRGLLKMSGVLDCNAIWLGETARDFGRTFRLCLQIRLFPGYTGSNLFMICLETLSVAEAMYRQSGPYSSKLLTRRFPALVCQYKYQQ
jgi:hypothetical protein